MGARDFAHARADRAQDQCQGGPLRADLGNTIEFALMEFFQKDAANQRLMSSGRANPALQNHRLLGIARRCLEHGADRSRHTRASRGQVSHRSVYALGGARFDTLRDGFDKRGLVAEIVVHCAFG
jgi:hypothetical protein